MLGIRLARGAGPLVWLLRLLVAAAAAGVALLLLSALGYALERPTDRGEALVRLVWCLVPLATAASLAAAVPAVDPTLGSRPGLAAAGLGPARLRLLAAGSSGAPCLVGGGLGLLLFLQLRGELTRLPPHGTGAWVPGVDRSLPAGAVVLLVGLLPLVAAVSAAVSVRPHRRPVTAERRHPRPSRTVPAPAGLPWGAAAVTAGLAVETVAGRLGADGAPGARALGTVDATTPGVLAGWVLVAVGAVLAGPGIAHLCGRLVAAGRPGALRLLSGRALQAEAHRVGHPLGALCAVASGVLAAVDLAASGGGAGLSAAGPWLLVGMGLALVCTAGALAATVVAVGASRRTTVVTLRQLGAPQSLLRAARAVRAVVLVVVSVPAVVLLAELTALPLRG